MAEMIEGNCTIADLNNPGKNDFDMHAVRITYREPTDLLGSML